MLRDLLARVALGMLGTAIAVSCAGEEAKHENLGAVQLALAGSAAGGADAGGAPSAEAGAPTVGSPLGGAGGEGGQTEPACTPQSCAQLGDCVFCNANNGKCENYKASDDHECRGATGACDVAELCDGGAACPDDEVADEDTPCASAPDPGDLCDLQDTCDGISKTCDDAVRPQGFECGPSQGACDVVEECDGQTGVCPADAFRDSSEVCRPAAANAEGCDEPDYCPGDSAACPIVDEKVDDGTPCTSGDKCNLTATCQGGLCSGVTSVICAPPSQCKLPGVCNPLNGNCLYANRPNNTPCDDGIACTEGDACGNGVCNPGVERDSLCPQHDCASVTCDVTATDVPDRCVIDPSAGEGLSCNTFVPDSCDVEEFCDGINPDCPSDGVAALGAECEPEACIDGGAASSYQAQATCDGQTKACVRAPLQSCDGYACGGTQCRSDCAADADCDDEHYCANGVCEERIGRGDPCENDTQCEGGARFCVDGVCCTSECGEICEACDVAGSLGVCTAVTGAPHGDRPACAGDQSACNGVCNGQLVSACTFPSAQTVCLDAACDPATGMAVEQAFCDGVGNCAATDAIACTPFTCGATACRGDCVSDGQCAAGAFCKAGVCTPTQDAGERCTRDAQCESGFCTDGVCCEARCDGQCEACAAGGKCNAVQGTPAGERPACAGDDACAGECDGQNRLACTYPGAAVVCREAACVDGEATVAAACNGGGACARAESVSCPNGCEGTICAGDECLVGSDCEAGERCVAGTCAPQGEPGSACSAASDCASGFCVDGVCCDSACDGQCEACDGSNRPGTCSPIEGAPHGSRPPCTSDGSTCGGTCDGEDPAGCSYARGTVCSPGQCMPGEAGAEAVAIVESQCNGSGRCPAPRQQACGGAGCDPAAQLCNGECADGSPCGGGEYCSAGICVPTEPNGTACQAAQQCASGHCVDGYCCGSACDDRCAACDVPGELGKCTPVAGNTHGGRPGCPGGGACGAQCDGLNVTSCSFPDEDVSCAEPYCHDGRQVGASVCDGAGQCSAGVQTACAAFACDGDQCSDVCESDEDCTGTLQCREGVCVEPFLIDAVDEGTCGCRAPGRGSGPSGAGLLVAALALLSVGRRRARARAASLAASEGLR